MMNNILEEIGRELSRAEKILLYPHVNMDGDTLGSSVALCIALRKMGKACYILIEDEIPGNLQFLDRGYCTFDQEILMDVDLSICIDCGDAGRFEKRREKFDAGKKSICIDHHLTTDSYCDLNYIDSKSAAVGQMVFKLLRSMNFEIDKEMGEAIFAAITTDTGNFQYSNTSRETHEITAQLYDAGIDSNMVSVELYETVRPEKMMLKNKALGTLSLFGNGRGAVAYATQQMLKETGARMDETEGVVQDLRSISGVEIAAFLKEDGHNQIKVSLRSKRLADVSAIAAEFGGGGHERAAGFTLHCSLDEAVDIIKEKAGRYLG